MDRKIISKPKEKTSEGFILGKMDGMNNYNILAGHLLVTTEQCILSTILGSCVGVCLYDTENHIAGLNHYLLPVWEKHGPATPKYGDISIEMLIKKMLLAGSNIENIEAKVFGGGDVINLKENVFKVGQRNINIALQKLEEHHINIVEQNVGGRRGRKVFLNTIDGSTVVNFV
jgi:chemotaxis protein CheD